MLGESLPDVLVDREESLAGAPVHLADELAAKGIDDPSHRWGAALADEVEVKHALDSFWLHSIDETSCLIVEEGLFGGRTAGSGGSFESSDVVVGGDVIRGGSAIDTIGMGRR